MTVAVTENGFILKFETEETCQRMPGVVYIYVRVTLACLCYYLQCFGHWAHHIVIGMFISYLHTFIFVS